MGTDTAIAWADHTFNPWIGCTKLSPACDNCYAEAWAERFKTVEWGGDRKRTSAANWNKPLKWERDAEAFFAEHGRRQRVFCASLSDIFDNRAPFGARADFWQLVSETPELIWMLLTKRPQNIRQFLPANWDSIKGRIWLGTTIENRTEAHRRANHLVMQGHDAAVRFWSCEPLLEDLGDCIPFHLFDLLKGDIPAVNWVICGGESGPNFRPLNPDHVASLQQQCDKAGVPFFFKQWGGIRPAAGGHLIDGQPVQNFPER